MEEFQKLSLTIRVDVKGNVNIKDLNIACQMFDLDNNKRGIEIYCSEFGKVGNESDIDGFTLSARREVFWVTDKGMIAMKCERNYNGDTNYWGDNFKLLEIRN